MDYKFKEYTVAFLFTPDLTETLMIYKNRGPYPNTYNGLGGYLEDTDNTPAFGVVREIEEESAAVIPLEDIHLLLAESFPTCVKLHVFCGIVNKEDVRQTTDERLEWIKVSDILNWNINDERLGGDGNTLYFINASLKYLMERK